MISCAWLFAFAVLQAAPREGDGRDDARARAIKAVERLGGSIHQGTTSTISDSSNS
jgi:hypothetical protein